MYGNDIISDRLIDHVTDRRQLYADNNIALWDYAVWRAKPQVSAIVNANNLIALRDDLIGISQVFYL